MWRVAVTMVTAGVLTTSAGCGSQLSPRELAAKRAATLEQSVPAADPQSTVTAAGADTAVTADPLSPTGPAVDVGSGAVVAPAANGALPAPGATRGSGLASAPVSRARPQASSGPARRSAAVTAPAAKVGSRDPLVVGFQYMKGADVALAAVGAGDAKPASGDAVKALYQALIDEVNARGGLLGRKITPVWYAQDAQSTQSLSANDEAACATFTQDSKVTLAVLGGFFTEDLLACLHKARVFTFSGATFLFDDQVTFDSYPTYATAGALNLTRMSKVYVDSLFAQKYFTPGSKIGVVAYDSPPFARALEQALKPALAAHGLKIEDTALVPTLNNIGATGNAGPAIQSGVLRFQSKNIDRVLFLGTSGLGFVWMTSAEAQHYRPRYGLSTNDTPQPLAATAPAAQLTDSIGVGWNRAGDVADPVANAASKRCDSVLQARGLPTGGQGLGVCDHVWGLEAAVKAAGRFEADSITAALPKVGALRPATALLVQYGAGRRDGVAAAAPLAFMTDCTCFRYTGPEFSI
jgi:hypothetical protein